MAITLGLNITALRVKRELDRSTDRIAAVYERLSSGQRINGAAVDAAGLATAMRLNVDSRIANQARHNVSAGVSLLQVADSALQNIRDLLVRQAELAEQAASGSLSALQREALQKEYALLDEEIRRISATTSFNGINLLGGDPSARAARQLISSQVRVDYKSLDISADGRFAVYLNVDDMTLEQMDISTGERTVIANGLTGAFAQSASGNRVVFWSGSNLTGEDPNGYGQVYLWDKNNGGITQITHGTNGELWSLTNLYALTISADGSTIAFSSANHYNPDGSVSDYTPAAGTLHTYNIESRIFQDLNVQLSTDLVFLNLSANGRYLAFSSFNDITGGNGDFSEELYVVDTVAAPSTILQLTDTSPGHAVLGVQITNDGRVFFGSNDDIIGQNGAGANQLYEYRIATGNYYQHTNNTGGVLIVDRIGADGETVYFRANSNINQTNPELLTQFYDLDVSSGTITQRTAFTGADEIEILGRLSADGGTFVQLAFGGILEIVDLTPESTSIQISAGLGEKNVIETVLSSLMSAIRGVGGHSITTADAARGALEGARRNIDQLASARGTLGAGLQRLDIANRLLYGEVQEKDAARSRILDADIALEAADLIRYQLLQQTAVALLAQARSAPEIALQLLRTI